MVSMIYSALLEARGCCMVSISEYAYKVNKVNAHRSQFKYDLAGSFFWRTEHSIIKPNTPAMMVNML